MAGLRDARPPDATITGPPTLTALTLNPIQQLGYDYGSQLLAIAAAKNLIQPEAIEFICDFGAGTGGPSLALRDFFQTTDKRLTLLEADIPQAKTLEKLLPDSHLVAGDGLGWLSSPLSSDKPPQDLISAFMLGPDYENLGLVQSFMQHALPALSPQGRLLICSDTGTMHTVKRCLQNTPHIAAYWLLPDESANLPTAVVIAEQHSSTSVNIPDEPELPKTIIRKIDIPEADGFWTTETYCLATTFEKAYLHATIKTFELVTPEHPALPFLQDLWQENL